MSGDGKRGVAEWPKLPRPSSTLLGASVWAFFEVGLILGARAVIQGYAVLSIGDGVRRLRGGSG